MSRIQQKHSRLYRILVVIMYRKRYTLTISAIVLAAMIAGVCYYDWDVAPVRVPAPRSWSQIEASDTLCVVTVPSSYTVFSYRDRWYGYEYINASQVAAALGMKLRILLVNSEKEMVDSLFTGAADVAITPMAYGLVTGNWFLRPTGPRWADAQCIVSSRRLRIAEYADSLLTDSMEATLPHYRLSMIHNSAQWKTWNSDSVRAYMDQRPYLVDTLSSDSLTLEQLTDSMMAGMTDAVMMRCNVARLMHDFYPKMYISDTIPMSVDSLAWMVTAGADTLRMKIDSVSRLLFDQETPHYTVPIRNYRDRRRPRPRRIYSYVKPENGLSPYDDIFRRKAEAYNLDWRLLAGISYIESNFRHEIISSRGPVGLMQLMPQTIRGYDYTIEDALDPEINVELGSRLMARLCEMVRNRVSGVSDNDVLCFALAGYNAGLGHVYDAIRLAETLGYKPNVWADNVEHCLRLKADPQYYKMSVVKSGQFNGAFTINYVNEVMSAYRAFCIQTPQEQANEE